MNDADELFHELAPFIGAWRAYRRSLTPDRNESFEGFMNFLSQQIDVRAS